MNKSISYTPSVFNIPTCEMDPRLVALMMPFDEKFKRVCRAIKHAAKSLGLNCERADDIFENSVLIQDVFTLIFRASMIVCDCSGRNPNVLYETGIAHVLGRNVILIAQSLDDIPFDLRHHRIITYLPNGEGLRDLKGKLIGRMKTLMDMIDPNSKQLSDEENARRAVEEFSKQLQRDREREAELEILRMKRTLAGITGGVPAEENPGGGVRANADAHPESHLDNRNQEEIDDNSISRRPPAIKPFVVPRTKYEDRTIL